MVVVFEAVPERVMITLLKPELFRVTVPEMEWVGCAVPVPVSEISLVGVSGSLDWIRNIPLFTEAVEGEKVTWQVQVPD